MGKRLLQVTDLCFEYDNRPLLENIRFELLAGKLLHLQGENGSGKTTLMKLVAGLLNPTEGQIHFMGKAIHQDISIYQQQLCYIGHKPGISPALTLRENIQFDLHYGKKTIDLELSLERLSLKGLEDLPVVQLSAGQRRRIALLRLLMTNAKLWLLDEPFVALDARSIIFLKKTIEWHLEEGGSVLLTSHQALPFNQHIYQELSI